MTTNKCTNARKSAHHILGHLMIYSVSFTVICMKKVWPIRHTAVINHVSNVMF